MVDKLMVDKLLARALAFVETLKGLAEKKEATSPVTNEYAREYNRLRSDVGTAVPELSRDLPTEIKLSEDYNKTDATYVEVFTYAQQISDLLNDYQKKADL